MAERILFLNDHWLSTLCTPNTDVQQNYFPLKDNGELAASLNDFAACLNGSVVTNPPVVFEGWEAVVIPTEHAQDWEYVIYAGDQYFAVAQDSGPGASGNVITSPDGLVWTIQATPTANFWWRPIYITSKDLIVIPTDHDNDETTNFITSDDGGVTYVEGTTGFSTNHGEVPTLTGIFWWEEGGLYLAWGHCCAILSSPDLITWTDGILSGPGFWDTTNAIEYSPTLGLLVAIGLFGVFFYSSDGLTWVFNDPGTGFDVCYGGLAWSTRLALFVGSAEYHEGFNEKFVTSTDGVNWTKSPLGIPITQHVESQDGFLPEGPIEWDVNSNKFYTLTKGDNNGNFSGQSLVTPSMNLLTSTDGFTWVIDATVPNTHDFPYPVFGSHSYRDFAIKDADNMVLISRAMILRKIP